MPATNKMMIERLKNEMERAGVNARKLSDMANVGRSFVYDILNGKSCNPTTSKITAVANVLGVSVPYLVSGTSNDNEIITRTGDNFVCVLSAEVKVDKKGERSLATNSQSKSFFFQREWLENSLNANIDNLIAVAIEDETMSPTLQRKDSILVDKSDKFSGNVGVYLIFDGVNVAARRLEFVANSNGEKVHVISDNRKYTSYEVLLSDVEIVGRVIWYSRELD